MRRQREKFVALAGRERRQLIGSLMMLTIVEVSLRVLGFQRTLRMLQRRVSRGYRRHRTEAAVACSRGQVESTVEMVAVAARHGIRRASCLRRAMVAWYLLRRQGIAAELRIGVRKDQADAFEAHAWVEYQGLAIGDAEASLGGYRAFESLSKVPDGKLSRRFPSV